MTKEQLFSDITSLAGQGAVGEAEVVDAFRRGAGVPARATHARISVAEVLYYVGGAIVFIGLAVLVYQNWDQLNAAARVLATLGSAAAALVIGILLTHYPKLGRVAQAFYLIAGLTAPLGLAVAWYEAGLEVESYRTQSAMSGILLLTFGLAWWQLRQAIFTVFCIIFGTWLFFSITSWLVGEAPALDWDEYYQYRFFVTGLSYVLIGYSFAPGRQRLLTPWLYSVGAAALLGAALALGGWSPNQNIFWETIFPGLALGTIFLSIPMRSKAFLTFGSIFLMAYILKITAEYFKDTLGWPLALVLAGLALIGIGYGTFYLNKQYLAKQPTLA
ncbi:MAG TPA: hypothetical protein VJC05_00260 [Candidatus Andersenbacteria bacterium]|nr:hypothetical protein [Candidatus Andersenbacteria bacterium]